MKKSTKFSVLFSIVILITSYCTYVHNYSSPDGAFWDENYYIASAQKYLNGIFFMHEHPPLGQMLIALGEKLLHGNAQSDQFINADKVGDFPKGFSFEGYRLFPVLSAWLTPCVFFGILTLLTNSHIIGLLLSFLYLFDNALIVHSRGAMLDAPLMLFASLTILFFLLALRWKKDISRLIIYSIFLGFSFALVATTKLTGLILILLFPLLVWKLFPNWQKICLFLGLSLIAFSLTFVTIWQIHFSLGFSINPNLKNSGHYDASPEYKELIAQRKQGSLISFPLKIRDSFSYVKQYQKGVPILNLCKSSENGSPAFFWPLGARSINYRWETPDAGKSYRYLYLQSNPVIWLIGLFGVISTTSLLLISLFFPLKDPIENRFLIVTFLILYWGYMVIVSQLNRVMYLYHYFPPLLFSFCLFALWVKEIKRIGKWLLTKKRKTLILAVLAACILIAYRFYSPLTYYQPLTDDQFRQRMIFSLWDLRCVKCDRTSFFRP